MSTSAYMGNPHVNDVGTVFKLTMKDNQNGTLVVIDLTTWDVLKIEIQSDQTGPLTGSPYTASVVGSPSNGQMQYQNTTTTILTGAGTHRYRGIIKNSGNGKQFTGSWIVFEVDS